jgi:D-3-phosphoglycerate dehydrogenase
MIKLLDKADNLQFIARVGAGLESIDCDHAVSKITLIAAPEGIGMQLQTYFRNDFVAFNNLNKTNKRNSIRTLEETMGT